MLTAHKITTFVSIALTAAILLSVPAALADDVGITKAWLIQKSAKSCLVEADVIRAARVGFRWRRLTDGAAGALSAALLLIVFHEHVAAGNTERQITGTLLLYRFALSFFIKLTEYLKSEF